MGCELLYGNFSQSSDFILTTDFWSPDESERGRFGKNIHFIDREKCSNFACDGEGLELGAREDINHGVQFIFQIHSSLLHQFLGISQLVSLYKTDCLDILNLFDESKQLILIQ